MKSNFKSVLATVGLVATLAGLSSNASAYTWTLSPDSTLTAFGQTVVTAQPGAIPSIDFLSGGTQVAGIYGAGLTVAGGSSQTVFFDADLYTWDSYSPVTGAGTGYYDGFIVSVSTLGYYWNIAGLDPQTSNANTAIWSWGGNTFGDALESFNNAPFGGDSLTLNAGAPATYYISFVLDTKSLPASDKILPSYGSFHVKVPEPSMLGLLGVGLLAAGVAGRSRRKNVA